jgi:rfaE bifunctional protein nucleotidyltransferase chain/domain
VQTGGVASLRRRGSGLRVPQQTATPPAPTDRLRTVVATGGCFDLLHAGHIHTLAAARSLGDYLVVLLNSDESVRRLKGDDRPFQSQSDRAMVLGSLRDVDEVVVFDEDTPERALSRLRPDVWVKGGDYASVDLPEASLVRSWGGEVLTVPYLPGRSTTNLARLIGA